MALSRLVVCFARACGVVVGAPPRHGRRSSTTTQGVPAVTHRGPAHDTSLIATTTETPAGTPAVTHRGPAHNAGHRP